MPTRRSGISYEVAALADNYPGFCLDTFVLMGSAAIQLAIEESGLTNYRDIPRFRVPNDIDGVTVKRNRDTLLEHDSGAWRKVIHRRNRVSDGTEFQMTSVTDANDRFDIWRHWYDARRPLGDRQVYTDELAQDSWVHKEGFLVINPQRLRDMKKAAGRDNDLTDVRFMDAYLL